MQSHDQRRLLFVLRPNIALPPIQVVRNRGNRSRDDCQIPAYSKTSRKRQAHTPVRIVSSVRKFRPRLSRPHVGDWEICWIILIASQGLCLPPQKLSPSGLQHPCFRLPNHLACAAFLSCTSCLCQHDIPLFATPNFLTTTVQCTLAGP